MYVLIENVISNPYALLVVGFSLAGAMAFITFLRGALSGARQLTMIDENSEHLAHYRTHAVHGVVLMAFFFAVWEAVRWIANFFV